MANETATTGSPSTARFASAYLTLVTMVEAIAFEVLVSRAFELHASESGLTLRVWLELATTGMTILLAWLVFLGLTMTIGWRMTLSNLLVPFYFGVAQLVAIRAISDREPILWCVAAAAGYSVGLAIIASLRRGAPADVAARWARYRRSWVVLCSAMGSVATLAGSGAALLSTGALSALAFDVLLGLGTLLVVLALVLWLQILQQLGEPDGHIAS